MNTAAYAREKAERIKELKKAAGLDEEFHSVTRKIMESRLYDWNPTARLLLTQIAVLAMKSEDDTYPDDAPDDFQADKIGWCWMSQFKLGLRVGCDEQTIGRWIDRFREDGVILKREWRDDNMTRHSEYKIVESILDANQRPSQKRETCDRPPRYKSRPKSTQPRTAKGTFANAKQRGVMEEDDE
jgi:hypothetical protein